MIAGTQHPIMETLTQSLRAGHDLGAAQVREAVASLISENSPAAAKKDFLRALREKGETALEIAAFAQALLAHALTPELEGKQFSQPAAFVAGRQDPVLHYDAKWESWFPQSFKDLRFMSVIEGAGHWLQQEQPAATTAQMLRFLHEVEPR
jgi:pimeloyl-ACP methyl ester carboxylesterase